MNKAKTLKTSAKIGDILLTKGPGEQAKSTLIANLRKALRVHSFAELRRILESIGYTTAEAEKLLNIALSANHQADKEFEEMNSPQEDNDDDGPDGP